MLLLTFLGVYADVMVGKFTDQPKARVYLPGGSERRVPDVFLVLSGRNMQAPGGGVYSLKMVSPSRVI